MVIPSEFNGEITFYWSTKHEFMCASHHKLTDDYIAISEPIKINCALFDIREKQIEALKKQIAQEEIDSQFRINQMLGKIQELQAIESK